MKTNHNAALDFIGAYTTHLRTAIPAAKETLLRELAVLDGYIARGDAPKVTHTNESTPVEAAANQRALFYTDLNAIDDELDAAVKVLRNLLNDCRRRIATRVEVPRCAATGRDGAIEWADPNCYSPPSRGPLCDRCSKREYRWRLQHGLPPRADGVYSAA